jgi:hypothetical protein
VVDLYKCLTDFFRRAARDIPSPISVGSKANLKDRHRKQDPESALINLFHSVEQERNRLEAIYGPPGPP